LQSPVPRHRIYCMANLSFATQKADLDEACLFLRSFTLGKQGFTQRDGAEGIQRVNAQCDRLKTLFATGPHAKQAAQLVASARTRVIAAETRLALLQKKH
jgi:hypothetical protein